MGDMSAEPSMEDILAHPWLHPGQPAENARLRAAELNGVRHKLSSVPDRLVTQASPKPPRLPQYGSEQQFAQPQMVHYQDVQVRSIL